MRPARHTHKVDDRIGELLRRNLLPINLNCVRMARRAARVKIVDSFRWIRRRRARSLQNVISFCAILRARKIPSENVLRFATFEWAA